MLRNSSVPATILIFCLIVGCSSDDSPTKVETQDVNTYLAALPAWQEYSQQLPPSDGPLSDPLGEIHWEGNVMYVCTSTPCSITQTPDAIATFDPGTEILWLGSLIQGNTYKQGMAAMEELPIRQRAPLTVVLQQLTSEMTRTVNNPSMATVNQAIGDLVTSAEDAGYEPSSVMSFEKKTSYSLDQGMLKMGMSAKYMGVSVRSQLEMSQTVEEKSVMAYFRQRMFTVSLVLPQTPASFFSGDFTVDDLQAQENMGRIGPENLPVFVSSITYGRILVMTMTSTNSEQEMKAALQASYDGIVDVSADVSAEQLRVLNTSTINIVAVGGEAANALNLIRTGNLGDYFLNEVSLTSAVPISYTIRNLADNSMAQVSETTEYEIKECSTDAVAMYNDFDHWRNAILQVPGGELLAQGIQPGDMVDADEINSPPGSNNDIPAILNFQGLNTGFPLDFRLRAPQGQVTYNDTEFTSGFPLLSIGDVDNYENDDFEITVTRLDAGCRVFAMGTYVGDNGATAGESLRVYGEGDLLLKEFTAGLPPNGVRFMGVLSAVPLYRIYYDEDSGGDDIFIKEFHFGVDCD